MFYRQTHPIQNGAQVLPVGVEVLPQERCDPSIPREAQVADVVDAHEVAAPDLAVPVEEHDDALVEPREELFQAGAGHRHLQVKPRRWNYRVQVALPRTVTSRPHVL